MLAIIIVVVACVQRMRPRAPQRLTARMGSATSAKVATSERAQMPREWNWQYVSAEDARSYLAFVGCDVAVGSYASRVVNQHSRSWCGSCYLVSAIQMLQDKLHVLAGRAHPERPMFPFVTFDLQAALDSYNELRAGVVGWNACRGGHPRDVLRAIQQGKVTLRLTTAAETLLGYPSTTHVGCTDGIRLELLPVQEHFENVNYPRGVQTALLTTGSLVLAVDATCMNDPTIHERGGVINEAIHGEWNHAVCVIGWRVVNGREHWIVRNSWGTTSAPARRPEDLSCVYAGANSCETDMFVAWRGDDRNPGFVYIPFDYPPLRRSHPSPWMDCLPSDFHRMACPASPRGAQPTT